MNVMIVGRVLTGVGGAATYCGGLTYITVLTTEHERPLYTPALKCMGAWGYLGRQGRTEVLCMILARLISDIAKDPKCGADYSSTQPGCPFASIYKS